MTNEMNQPMVAKVFSFIMRCPVKGCSTTFRVSQPGKIVTKHTRGIIGVPGSSQSFKATEPVWPFLMLHCATHKRELRTEIVNGKFSKDHICDSRCTGAKGHNCECSCGGANHGKDFEIA